jgi:hypothetical protein
MFRVEEVKRRGWLCDTVRIVATEDVDHVERALCWDAAGAPGFREDRLVVARGEAFEVTLPRKLAEPGRRLTVAEVGQAPGLRERWTGWEL